MNVFVLNFEQQDRGGADLLVTVHAFYYDNQSSTLRDNKLIL